MDKVAAQGWFADVWQRRILIAVLGGFAALGQAPFGWWWATVLSLSIWMVLAEGVTSGRRGFGLGFWFGFGYFAIALRWIISPFLVDPVSHGWMAPFAIVLMASGGGLFWGLVTSVATRFWPASLAALIVLVTAAETIRSLILTGFPWALLGHVWVDTPVAQLASWGGPHFLTVLTMLAAASLVWIVRERWMAVSIPVLMLGLGLLKSGEVVSSDLGAEPQIVRLIQPNAPQDEKWDADRKWTYLDRMLEFTNDGDVPDLVVWPETALTTLLEYSELILAEMSVVARGATLVTGVNQRQNGRFYNSFLVMDGNGVLTDIYQKSHLVPFGEFTPGGEWLKRLGLPGYAASDGQAFTPGSGDHLVNIRGIGPARALICYEGIFAEEISVGDERPRLLVLITNDAWFGNGAGPAQHLAQAQLRAIEQGLPMVRVANTGISAMIDPFGRITGQIALNTAGYLDVELPGSRPQTTYQRFGDTPVVILLCLALAGLVMLRRKA